MRRTLLALSLAAGIGVAGQQAAGAVPANAPALQEAATAAAKPFALHKTYYERHGRRGVVKCYREFVIGPYRCHRYYYW